MEGKVFLRKYLIWTILLLRQLHGSKSCVEKERTALLELKQYLISISREDEVDSFLPTWTYDTKSDCCIWEGVKCNRTTQRVTEIAFKTSHSKRSLKENFLLNLSLFHPFEDVRCLNLSFNYFNGLFDDVEGYKSLGRLRNLEILDLNLNQFNNSIFPFVNAATSLTTLSLFGNRFNGPFPDKELKDLTNLQVLDLCANRFNGSLSVQVSPALKKLKALDLSVNEFSASTGLQVICEMKNMQELNLRRNKLLGYKSLGKLRSLEILDLSSNRFNKSIFPFLNAATSLTTLFLRDNNYLNGSFPAKEVKGLTNLELLDLSRNEFNGSLPVQELSAFRMLKSLYLSGNQFSTPMGLQGYKSLRRLRNLEILDLSENAFDSSIFPFLNAATSLKTLFLRSNYMDGPFPAEELKDLINLELLDLSENKFNGSIPKPDSSAMRKLKALDLSSNEFSASMGLQGICEMKNLQELDLSRNKLVGQFPLCLTGLTGLQVLDLSSNQLTGKVPPALSSLGSLKYLSLLDNNFEGFFSLGLLANLSELRVFKLDSKSKSLQVESKGYWKPKFQLRVIELPSCNLVKVPYFLIYQKDLSRINLSDNKFVGDFPHWLLVNNTKLEVLLLQNNSLTSFHLPKSAHNLTILDVSANDFSNLLPENIGWVLPHLQYMKLADNNFQGYLPSSLGNMNYISYMDLSHNNLHGTLPRSLIMGGHYIFILRLSHNKLSGEVFPEPVNFTGIWELSMDNNLFTGKIGQGLRNLKGLQLLDLSSNNLTGVIPSWIGEFTHLSALLLSNNSLEGEIHVSLFNITYLELLDLSANTLSGGIPPYVNSTRPVVLLLQDNNLSGVISETLLMNISVLDLRNNRLFGNIPEFTNTQDIHTLLLRGNSLTGSIPSKLCGLRKIQLLDLANNTLNGSIPSCFNNTSFVFGKENSLYDQQDQDYGSIAVVDIGFIVDEDDKYVKSRIMIDEVTIGYYPITQIQIQFATKHRYDAYLSGNLELLYGIDLSDNELSGDIPFELGGLLELQVLNLSHNNLSGLIPKSFSGLKNVESLDLSFNRLQGRIPSQLTELSNLAVFNVSFNNLSGIIPEGKQFNTFGTPSYLGNPLLCGLSINTSCDRSHYQESDNGVEADESTFDMVSFYWSLAAAYVTILLGIFTSLSFDSPWSRFWFYLVDAFIHKAKNLFW